MVALHFSVVSFKLLFIQQASYSCHLARYKRRP